MSFDSTHVSVTTEDPPAAPTTANPAKRGERRAAAVDLIVKRPLRRDYDDDHDGGWKVAFADFCLALLCVFMLLWALSARDEETRRKMDAMVESALYDDSDMLAGAPLGPNTHALQDTLASHVAVDEAGEVKRGQPMADSREAMDVLAERVRKLGKDAGVLDNVQAIVTPMGLRVMLHDTEKRGVFVSGGAVPSEPFRPMLIKLGALMGSIGNPLFVMGHTDSVPYRNSDSSSRSNWDLSVDRAMSARSWVLQGGVNSEQVMQVIGMADRAPLVNNPRAAINRRIEFLVLTPERARAICAMFGPTGQVVPLTPGINATSAGDPDAGRVGAEVGVKLDKKRT
ncbi:flagellar motor protein MotB [Burkholderia cenocepacia]|uniref:flagellar motor protein MotB n=1 Tax=Burkholderia cenocepacia TaxID=95486 RepID=UPI00158DC09E|nr:flagellar motor protein MotB [Burkholderia cenocepacia]